MYVEVINIYIEVAKNELQWNPDITNFEGNQKNGSFYLEFVKPGKNVVWVFSQFISSFRPSMGLFRPSPTTVHI